MTSKRKAQRGPQDKSPRGQLKARATEIVEDVTNFDGVDSAIMEDFGRYLDGVRQRAKGGAE